MALAIACTIVMIKTTFTVSHVGDEVVHSSSSSCPVKLIDGREVSAVIIVPALDEPVLAMVSMLTITSVTESGNLGLVHHHVRIDIFIHILNGCHSKLSHVVDEEVYGKAGRRNGDRCFTVLFVVNTRDYLLDCSLEKRYQFVGLVNLRIHL